MSGVREQGHSLGGAASFHPGGSPAAGGWAREETTPEREGSQDHTGPAAERGRGGREGQPGTNPAAAHQAERAQALNQGSAGRGQPSAQRPQQQAGPSCFGFLGCGQLFFVTQGETFGGRMRPEIIRMLSVFLQATSSWTILRK